MISFISNQMPCLYSLLIKLHKIKAIVMEEVTGGYGKADSLHQCQEQNEEMMDAKEIDC